MDGVHDLGGKEGCAALDYDPEVPVFAARWEASVFAMTGSLGAFGITKNTDQFRHAVERIEPAAYLTHGYYGRWLGGLENLLVEAGVITQDELSARAQQLGAGSHDLIAARPSASAPSVPDSTDPFSNVRETTQKPKFAAGDRVRTQRFGVPGHTRLPAYARGAIGEIIALHGAWVFPDTNAAGAGEQPTHLYTVCFAAQDLWGPAAEADSTVRLDLFEPYLTIVANDATRTQERKQDGR